MGLKAMLKAQKAYKAHAKGDRETAMQLYEEAVQAGLDQPRFLLAYSVLLIRSGQYEKAKSILVGMQRNPALAPSQKTELFVNYAACAYKLGELDKGINLLKKQHLHAPSGLLYQTLGYLLVEKYDRTHTPDFDAMEAAAAAAEQAAQAEAAGENAEGEGSRPAEEETEEPVKASAPSPREVWQKGIQETEAFLQEAVDYDEEDAICLDNMGQFLYRVKGDREAARPWFDRAHQQKPGQIDTLWFLSRYDMEAGNREAALEKLKRAAEGRFSPLNHMDKAAIEAEIARLSE